MFINRDSFDSSTDYNNQRPLIWFHHVHKAGGTSFVKLAELNGEKLYYQESRNGLPANKYGYFIPFGKMNKNEQKNFIDDAKKNGTTFIATEFDFPKPENRYFGNVINVIILRNPVDRLISHLAHLLREPEEIRFDYKNRNIDHIIKTNTPFFANIMTKVLSGHSFDYKGNLTDYDYTVALENLKKFNTIIILEDPQSYRKMQKYGWNNFNFPYENNSQKRDFETNVGIDTVYKTREALRKIYGPKFYQKLKELSNYDEKLYNYAKNLSDKNYK